MRSPPGHWRARQVEAFLDSLYAEGAFVGRTGEQSYFVVCDERINTEETMRAGKINLAFGFAATKPGEYHAFLVTHQPSGSRAQVHQRESLRQLFAERRSRRSSRSILRGLVPLAPVVPPLGSCQPIDHDRHDCRTARARRGSLKSARIGMIRRGSQPVRLRHERTNIHFDIGSSTLGRVLVAGNDKGVCAILHGGPATTSCISQLRERFPDAELSRDVAAVGAGAAPRRSDSSNRQPVNSTCRSIPRAPISSAACGVRSGKSPQVPRPATPTSRVRSTRRNPFVR